MDQPNGTRGSPKGDELLRLPGAPTAAAAPKAVMAALRKRPEEEVVPPETPLGTEIGRAHV